MAYRTVDEPAEMACVEFPCGTGLPGLGRAAPNLPAGMDLLTDSSFEGLQEEHLTLNVRRYLPPALLEALNSLKRCSQKLPHLFLGLVKFFPESLKLFSVHFYSSFWEKGKIFCSAENFLLDMLYHAVLPMQKFFSLCQKPQKKICTMPRLRGEVYSPQQ